MATMAGKWSFEINKPEGSRKLRDPLGYNAPTADVPLRSEGTRGTYDVKIKKAWELAKSPIMTVVMAFFLFYMIGNSIQIITILVTMSMLIPQVRALFKINETFKPLEDPQTKDQLVMCKLIYGALHIVVLAAAIYKFSSMGLIPVRPIDWLSLVNYVQPNSISTNF